MAVATLQLPFCVEWLQENLPAQQLVEYSAFANNNGFVSKKKIKKRNLGGFNNTTSVHDPYYSFSSQISLQFVETLKTF